MLFSNEISFLFANHPVWLNETTLNCCLNWLTTLLSIVKKIAIANWRLTLLLQLFDPSCNSFFQVYLFRLPFIGNCLFETKMIHDSNHIDRQLLKIVAKKMERMNKFNWIRIMNSISIDNLIQWSLNLRQFMVALMEKFWGL